MASPYKLVSGIIDSCTTSAHNHQAINRDVRILYQCSHHMTHFQCGQDVSVVTPQSIPVAGVSNHEHS